MDVLEFVKQHARMCDAFDCDSCALKDKLNCCAISDITKEAVKIVEDWAAAHPAKTRQSEFLKQWPNAKLDGDGVLTVCPDAVNKGECYKCDIGKMCAECCREFWLKEVE